MCGTITKLVIFNKQGKEQALVQFERAEDAATAMERFQGKNIYSGCNTLNIQYSNLPDITVKYNNDRSYDFTNPSLPAGAGDQGLGADALLSGASPRNPSSPFAARITPPPPIPLPATQPGSRACRGRVPRPTPRYRGPRAASAAAPGAASTAAGSAEAASAWTFSGPEACPAVRASAAAARPAG